MTIKWQDAALLLLAAFLLGLLLATGGHSVRNQAVHEKEVVRDRLDTSHTVVSVPFAAIQANSRPNRTKTIVLHDTVYREACLDTLIASDTAALAPDTLSVCYARDAFSLALGLAARRKNIAVPYVAHDTFYWRDNEEQFRENKQPWYDALIGIVIALAAGIIVGKL